MMEGWVRAGATPSARRTWQIPRTPPLALVHSSRRSTPALQEIRDPYGETDLMIRRILALAFLVAARTAGAQGIVGVVADSATDEPLRCVDVALVDSTDHVLAWTSTAADGAFRFDSSASGGHHLRFNVWHHVPIAASLPTPAPVAGSPTRYRLAFQLGDQHKPKYWPDTTDSPPGRPIQFPQGGLLYPPALRKQHIEGGVLTRYVLDEKGFVDPASIRFIQSDDPAFSASVDDFLRRVQLTPARRAGRPVCALVLVLPYHFTIQGG